MVKYKRAGAPHTLRKHSEFLVLRNRFHASHLAALLKRILHYFIVYRRPTLSSKIRLHVLLAPSCLSRTSGAPNVSVWDFTSSNRSRHSSFHSFRFRAEGVENPLQTTNYFELDTHATHLWTV